MARRGSRTLIVGGDEAPEAPPALDMGSLDDAVADLNAGVFSEPQTILLDAELGRRAGYTRPAEAPIAAAVNGTPSVCSWRVFKDVDGVRTWLGTLGTHAQPEALVRRFPGAMPPPGQIANFVLKGITPTGRETGGEVHFPISGDSPEVQEARAGLLGPGTMAQAAAPDLSGLAESVLADARSEAKRLTDALTIERRELADRALAVERERAAAVKVDADARIATIREEARIEREREAERRRQDREDLEARYRADREERERRDKRDAEERDRRDRLEREAREAERDREREHQKQMAAMTAASSLETTVTKAGTLMGALGLNPAKIVEKFLGVGDEVVAPAVGEGTAAAIAGVVGKLIEQVGAVVIAQQQIQAGQGQGHGVIVTQPRLIPSVPRQLPSPAPPASDPPVAAPDTALAGVPMPVQRKARVALRNLAEVLGGVTEEHWATEVVQSVGRTPEILPFVRAVGVKRAAREAGLSATQAEKIEAAVPPGVLG